jgi:hypothetical protein
LRVTHVAESPALSSSTAIRAAANCKNTPYFPLCNGGAHDRDTGGVGGDGVVDEAVVGDVSKVMEVAGDASGFRRPWEKRRVGQDTKNHVRGPIDTATVRMGRHVAQ